MAEPSALGVGLVGYGLAGRSFHAPFIASVEGLRLCAIVTSDSQRAGRAAKDHPDAVVLATVDELLGRTDVEIVVVAAPNRHHFSIASQALAAGRHVVVDKPITTHVPEADRLIEAAARSGLVLSVFQNRRWDGDFLTIRRLIDAGTLGPIDSLESRFELMIPVVGAGWRESATETGGPLRDLGSHLVDQSVVLFGAAQRVWAQADRRRPSSEVDDSVFIAIDHESGVRSRHWMSLVAPRPGPRFRVRGLAGEYVKQDLDAQEAQLVAGMRPTAPGFGEEPPERWGHLYGADGSESRVPTGRGNYGKFYEILRQAVLGHGPAPVDPVESVRVLRILEAAERAATTGSAQMVVAA